MLRLRLADHSGQVSVLGPTSLIKAVGPELKLGPREETVGEHAGDCWRIGERALTRLEVDGSATVRFEDTNGAATEPLGPFELLRIVNGYVFAGGTLLACFSREEQRWCLLSADESWPIMLVCAAAPVPAEVRLRMIAEAAYYRAEKRGFSPGRDREDWIAAEQDIDASLAPPG